MKQHHFLATMKTCLLAAASSALLFTSCAQDGFDEESFNGSGTVLELPSPDATTIKVVASPDGKKQTISWADIPGANRYQVSLYIKNDMENPVFADSIVKEATVTADRIDETFYVFKVQTLDNIPENNKSLGEVTEKEFNTFIQPYGTIDPAVNPDYSDIYKYFEANPIPDDAEDAIEGDDKTLYFYLIGGEEYTMSSSVNFGNHIVELRTMSKDNNAKITLGTGANLLIQNKFGLSYVDVDASQSGANFIKINTPATDFVTKPDGSASNYRSISEIKVAQCNISGVTKNFINNGGGNILFDRIIITNTIIEMAANEVVFAFASSYPVDFQMTNSTLWSNGVHKNFLFQAQGRPKDTGYATSWTVDHCTLYKISMSKKFNNNNSGIKGQTTTFMTLTNSILMDCSVNADAINGWLWGQNSTAPTLVYGYNTYWSADGEVAGWTDSSKTGYDNSGTSLKTNPSFTDPENGIFTPTGADQVANKTGDPRWYEVQ